MVSRYCRNQRDVRRLSRCCTLYRSKGRTELEGIVPRHPTNQPNYVGGGFRKQPLLPKIGHTANDDQWSSGLLSLIVQLHVLIYIYMSVSIGYTWWVYRRHSFTFFYFSYIFVTLHVFTFSASKLMSGPQKEVQLIKKPVLASLRDTMPNLDTWKYM